MGCEGRRLGGFGESSGGSGVGEAGAGDALIGAYRCGCGCRSTPTPARVYTAESHLRASSPHKRSHYCTRTTVSPPRDQDWSDQSSQRGQPLPLVQPLSRNRRRWGPPIPGHEPDLTLPSQPSPTLRITVASLNPSRHSLLSLHSLHSAREITCHSATIKLSRDDEAIHPRTRCTLRRTVSGRRARQQQHRTLQSSAGSVLAVLGTLLDPVPTDPVRVFSRPPNGSCPSPPPLSRSGRMEGCQKRAPCRGSTALGTRRRMRCCTRSTASDGSPRQPAGLEGVGNPMRHGAP